VHSKDVGGTAKTAEYTYDYAVIRVVPRVERGEAINVGVIEGGLYAFLLPSPKRTDCAGARLRKSALSGRRSARLRLKRSSAARRRSVPISSILFRARPV